MMYQNFHKLAVTGCPAQAQSKNTTCYRNVTGGISLLYHFDKNLKLFTMNNYNQLRQKLEAQLLEKAMKDPDF